MGVIIQLLSTMDIPVMVNFAALGPGFLWIPDIPLPWHDRGYLGEPKLESQNTGTKKTPINH